MRTRLFCLLLLSAVWGSAECSAQGLLFKREDLASYRNEQWIRAVWSRNPDLPAAREGGHPTVRALSENRAERARKFFRVVDEAAKTREWVRGEFAFMAARDIKAAALPQGSTNHYDAVFYRGKFKGFYLPGTTHMVQDKASLDIRRNAVIYGTNHGMARELGYRCSVDGVVCIPPEAGLDTSSSDETLPAILERRARGIYGFGNSNSPREAIRFPMLEQNFTRGESLREKPDRDDQLDIGIFEDSFDAWYDRESSSDN